MSPSLLQLYNLLMAGVEIFAELVNLGWELLKNLRGLFSKPTTVEIRSYHSCVGTRCFGKMIGETLLNIMLLEQ